MLLAVTGLMFALVLGYIRMLCRGVVFKFFATLAAIGSPFI